MKACLVVALFLVAFAVVTSAADIGHTEPSVHVLLRRETIRGPTFPNACVFYQCIASCRSRGYKSGGYCTLNGCQCLR
ncbi:hypothetical protein PYW07_015784 [Mythimna separata]|uniref:Uncharacterized protein n=1 Tax=Mythimna separata TaxID=271217 RepID=A0AAD8DVR2_MYTSE|nr:hypothetical protein PYW07_015784 [Mythimna separata]